MATGTNSKKYNYEEDRASRAAQTPSGWQKEVSRDSGSQYLKEQAKKRKK